MSIDKIIHRKASDYVSALQNPDAPELETSKPFHCPRCGGEHFGRDTASSRGQVVVLDTVRCQTGDCEWRGDWPPRPGRPTREQEAAAAHVHIRTTLVRKSAWVRAALAAVKEAK